MMSGLIAPQSPAETRWETLWGYMQGGPGVFKGDLHFYRVDGDFRDRVGRIDTARCPLYLLTGEYDFSCTPDDTRATAEKIPGAKLTDHAGDRPLPDERAPRAVPEVPPARPRRDPRPRALTAAQPAGRSLRAQRLRAASSTPGPSRPMCILFAALIGSGLDPYSPS